jgi:hypothetical protein
LDFGVGADDADGADGRAAAQSKPEAAVGAESVAISIARDFGSAAHGDGVGWRRKRRSQAMTRPRGKDGAEPSWPPLGWSRDKEAVSWCLACSRRRS